VVIFRIPSPPRSREVRREDVFFSGGKRTAREKALCLFEAKKLCRSLPQAERLPFVRPPPAVGQKKLLCALCDFAVNTSAYL